MAIYQARMPKSTANILPLTPPSTVEKKDQFTKSSVQYKNISPVRPKKLLQDLIDTNIRTENTKKISKKRRLLRLKPNSIISIDSHGLPKPSEQSKYDYLNDVINSSENIIIVAGAGISTHVGIPDFRSQQNGLYTVDKYNKSLFDLNLIYSDEETTKNFNHLMIDLFSKSLNAEPTPFHRLIDKIAEQGRLKRLYTQNIDSLETKLKNLNTQIPLSISKKPYPNLIQLHGTITETKCSKCNNITKLVPSQFQTNENSDGSLMPTCKECEEMEMVRSVAGIRSKGVGYIRPLVTLYNEVHADGETLADIINYDIKQKKCDSLIIVGTTLSIPHVKKLCQNLAHAMKTNKRKKKGNVIFISNEMPNQSLLNSFQDMIDLIVLGDCQNLCKYLT